MSATSIPENIDASVTREPLKLRSITKRFGALTALDHVDLDIEPGKTTVLLGPSGSGKSTLLRSINLLEKPDEGTLDFGGGPIEVSQRLSDQKIREIRRHSTMVFQQFNLFPHLTALQNVTLAPVKSRGMAKAEARERGIEALTRVGLAEKVDSYPSRLSGGQQQRVAIARALALSPDYLLFDEPTSALDPELAAEVIAVLSSLAAEHRTLVVVTHSLQFARSVADRLVFLEEGKILFNGDPEHFFNSEDERLKRFVSVVGSV
ncbi:hypothetical protein DAD186_08020 [Dermabacter vaginalis]|uniref:ABC transporter domain-containing protein n=1 Tax=Dermabacter vaginalis TaxID=1630135 RepID=A0A1B0ZHH2_9MICO|nr:amino acid ABC transporter ATP-binding protein [Dermabacter vaginalis]ANP27352.1 hypothetical protein DAD186_08020 [Dermabacter vaginalis]